MTPPAKRLTICHLVAGIDAEMQQVLECLPPEPHGITVGEIAVELYGRTETSSRTPIVQALQRIQAVVGLYVEESRTRCLRQGPNGTERLPSPGKWGEHVRYGVPRTVWPLWLRVAERLGERTASPGNG